MTLAIVAVFLVGVFVGVFVGTLVLSLCAMAGREDASVDPVLTATIK